MATYPELSASLAVLARDRGTGVDDRAIGAAEARLGRFPDDYRAFLNEYGWVGVRSYEIYGLGEDVPPYLDVVRLTLAERTEPAIPLSAGFVGVMNNGAGHTPQMQSIADRYGLDLDGSWNQELMAHLGRHPNAYHEFVLDGMRTAAREAGTDRTKFLELFDQYVKQPVIDNPGLLRRSGWGP